MIHLRSTLGELDEALAAGIWALEFAARLGDLKLRIQTTSHLAQVYSHRAERDPKVTVRRMLYAQFPGAKQFLADPASTVPQLRKKIMLSGCGHWTQQERATEVNAAMIEFLKSL